MKLLEVLNSARLKLQSNGRSILVIAINGCGENISVELVNAEGSNPIMDLETSTQIPNGGNIVGFIATLKAS